MRVSRMPPRKRAPMTKTRSQVHDKKQELEETVLLGTLEEEQSKIEIIYKEPPTELKLEVGEQLFNHKKTWQDLSASMKRQGYHHSKPALYRWKEHYAAGTRPRHAGGQTNLTSPQRKLVDDQAATAVVTRSAKSVKAFKRLVALAYLNSRKERGVSSLGIPPKKTTQPATICAHFDSNGQAPSDDAAALVGVQLCSQCDQSVLRLGRGHVSPQVDSPWQHLEL